MEKPISKIDEEFIIEYKKLTLEQKEKIQIVVKWLAAASKADVNRFRRIMESKDSNVINAFVESMATKFKNLASEVAAI